MATPKTSFSLPHADRITSSDGFLSEVWNAFFRAIYDRLFSLGKEESFKLVNNQASWADITGLKFDYNGVSLATVDFLIQRVTTGASAVERIYSGMILVMYLPSSNSWLYTAVATGGDIDHGVSLQVTSAGQFQYKTTNEVGTPSISKMYWRSRTLAGKNSLYSSMGAR